MTGGACEKGIQGRPARLSCPVLESTLPQSVGRCRVKHMCHREKPCPPLCCHGLLNQKNRNGVHSTVTRNWPQTHREGWISVVWHPRMTSIRAGRLVSFRQGKGLRVPDRYMYKMLLPALLVPGKTIVRGETIVRAQDRARGEAPHPQAGCNHENFCKASHLFQGQHRIKALLQHGPQVTSQVWGPRQVWGTATQN